MTMLGVGKLAWISLLPGAVVQGIAGLYFVTYAKATTQLGLFHACLERMGRYLLANSMCENMAPDHRDAARSELVRIMANAEPLSIEGFSKLPTTTLPRKAPPKIPHNNGSGSLTTAPS